MILKDNDAGIISAISSGMTLTLLRAHCKSLGLTVRKTDGEYRITVLMTDKALAERLAYYTNDIQDAYDTATVMSKSK